MDTKVCSKCGIEKPATLEYFRSAKKSKSGLTSECKECSRKHYYENHEHYKLYQAEYSKQRKEEKKQYDKEYREKNAEKLKEKDKQKYLRNKSKIAERMHDYYLKHKEQIFEYQYKYKASNPEKYKEWRQKWEDNHPYYTKQYTEANKEHIRNRNIKYRKENKEKVKASIKAWIERNKERYREICAINSHQRRANAKQLPSSFTKEQWKDCKHEFGQCCAYCGKYSKKLTQEHFIPVSKGGEFTINNIIPACGPCNYSKQDKDFFDWYPKQPFYQAEREKKILDYLGYKDGVQQLSIL
jgi:hypothetical protein